MKCIVEESILSELGLTTAAKGLSKNKSLVYKIMLAKENYRYITEDNFREFNERLKKQTYHIKDNTALWFALQFTPIKDYTGIPPEEVLGELKKARGLNIFDDFEIVTMEEKRERIKAEDPLLLGVIHGCPVKFYIAEWDNDISIEDILMSNEG